MKKILGYLSILFITLLGLVSCSNQSVYKFYKDEKIDLGKDTIYKLVTADELVNIKKNATEVVYCFYGSAKDFDCKGSIKYVQEQAKTYNVEVIYYINADLYDTPAKRSELQKLIEINDASVSKGNLPTLLAYNCDDADVENGKYTFDTSLSDFKRHFTKTDGKLDFELLCPFMFRDKCDKTKLPAIK